MVDSWSSFARRINLIKVIEAMDLRANFVGSRTMGSWARGAGHGSSAVLCSRNLENLIFCFTIYFSSDGPKPSQKKEEFDGMSEAQI